VPCVFIRAAFAGCAEGLTGTRSCPDFAVVGPSGEPEGVGPDADPGEEVALGEASEIVGSNIDN